MKYANLDIVSGEKRKITLNKVDYIVPAEIPVKKMVKCQKCCQDFSVKPEQPELLEYFMKSLFDILTIEQPDLNYDNFDMKPTAMTALYNFLYAGISPEETLKAINDAMNEVKPELKKKE